MYIGADWSFGQLRAFIEYKAKLAGVPVLFVDPPNSSKTLSRYGTYRKATVARKLCFPAGVAASKPTRTRARRKTSPLGAP